MRLQQGLLQSIDASPFVIREFLHFLFDGDLLVFVPGLLFLLGVASVLVMTARELVLVLDLHRFARGRKRKEREIRS